MRKPPKNPHKKDPNCVICFIELPLDSDETQAHLCDFHESVLHLAFALLPGLNRGTLVSHFRSPSQYDFLVYVNQCFYKGRT